MRRWGAVGVGIFLLGAAAWAVDASVLAERGKSQFERGDYNRALETFLKLKKEDPANPVAREYISKCTQKIMEAQKSSRQNRAILRGDPSVTTIPPKEPAPEWTTPPNPPRSPVVPSASPVKKSSARPVPLVPGTALEKGKKPSRFIASREILTEGYKNKILEGRVIDLVRKGRHVEIVAFMNRLFLPFSDAFAPDAVPAIESISRDLQSDPGDTILLRAVDSLTPAVRHQMLDLPTRRMSILFSTLVHASLEKPGKEGRDSFTAADFDD